MTPLHRRGVTLIEILVVVALVGLLSGALVLGQGALGRARLKSSTAMVAGAIRAAYNHASATSRPTRLVFDFDQRSVALEQSEQRMLLRQGERTGGAAATTEAERNAVEAAEEILQGPREARPEFRSVAAEGFTAEEGGSSKTLASGIRFRQVEVAHEDEPVRSERVYLYFWPGGQTERAAIQIQRGEAEAPAESEVLTVLVAPLTGKVQVLGGPADMPRPRTEAEESEREEGL
ncbi:MAG: prepilin-type N-terminal cleavage/methylation domain-containing protein [Deltaproteobacteria bacterium]|nr:prepilin-type N-terminal cleavage/methylation domain-containing protein [Deltaproteobacteria bacterium]